MCCDDCIPFSPLFFVSTPSSTPFSVLTLSTFFFIPRFTPVLPFISPLVFFGPVFLFLWIFVSLFLVVLVKLLKKQWQKEKQRQTISEFTDLPEVNFFLPEFCAYADSRHQWYIYTLLTSRSNENMYQLKKKYWWRPVVLYHLAQLECILTNQHPEPQLSILCNSRLWELLCVVPSVAVCFCSVELAVGEWYWTSSVSYPTPTHPGNSSPSPAICITALL